MGSSAGLYLAHFLLEPIHPQVSPRYHCRYAALHTGCSHLAQLSPSFLRLCPHFFVLLSCTIPVPLSTSLLQSLSSLISITSAAKLHSPTHPKGCLLHFALSSLAFHWFSSFSMCNLLTFVFTLSHYAYVFLQIPSCLHWLLVFYWGSLWAPPCL